MPIGDLALHVVESGPAEGRPFLFPHGRPESWRTWLGVMTAAGGEARTIAVDLPGIGGSSGAVEGGSKRRPAEVVQALVRRLGLTGTTLVGHDAGGMAAYAYLRRFAAEGFRATGVRDLTTAVVADAGHFAQEEQPAAVWALLRDFAAAPAA
ncbi:alpha/beta fold hydrolase [Kitasatospora brasiliensis]|uniref:alpha/beta fold hydrolase n=1 Tax=Kitasatospora brasiliensis TaxID=3058040 RepID=UPI00292D7710|nr:alpha/beta fold hydrolase [Kitasatospora sp. K002]